VTNHVALSQETLDEISTCERLCRCAIEEIYPALVEHLPDIPQSPQGCFELLNGIPYDRGRVLALRRLRTNAECVGIGAAYAVERYIVLQAYLVALPRLHSLLVDDCIHHEFCRTCRLVALPPPARENRLAQDSDAFAELAQIVTLRRFHAGQLSFDIMNMPRAWVLKLHPFDLAGLTRELVLGLGGFGPVVMPHVNYWRSNPTLLLKGEQERALWRIAKSVERRRRIKGLVASSWLYSSAVGRTFAHLAWVREFFTDQDAYIVDVGAPLVDAGFLVGSERRRQLYAKGKFRPRETLVIWRRADMLAWADNHPELGATASPQKSCISVIRYSLPPLAKNPQAERSMRSGQYTLIDCKRWLFYRPRRYISLVLLVPALCAAALTTTLWTPTVACPVFVLVLFIIWLFQYFFLQ
jgi:hypothetical protein